MISTDKGIENIKINTITWEGHKFLDNIRNHSIFNTAKETIKNSVGSASISILQSVSIKLIKAKLGI